jgi:hypothetical protein
MLDYHLLILSTQLGHYTSNNKNKNLKHIEVDGYQNRVINICTITKES